MDKCYATAISKLLLENQSLKDKVDTLEDKLYMSKLLNKKLQDKLDDKDICQDMCVELVCNDCCKKINFSRQINGVDYCLKCAPPHEVDTPPPEGQVVEIKHTTPYTYKYQQTWGDDDEDLNPHWIFFTWGRDTAGGEWTDQDQITQDKYHSEFYDDAVDQMWIETVKRISNWTEGECLYINKKINADNGCAIWWYMNSKECEHPTHIINKHGCLLTRGYNSCDMDGCTIDTPYSYFRALPSTYNKSRNYEMDDRK